MYNQVPNQPMNPNFPPPPNAGNTYDPNFPHGPNAGNTYNPSFPAPPGYQPQNPQFDPYNQQNKPQPQPHNAGFNPYGDDGSLSKNLSEGNARIGFIRKVYGILTAQLALTAFSVSLAMIDPIATSNFYRRFAFLWVVAMVGYMVTLYALGCYKSIARSVPTNYILLSIFTGCMSYMVAGITSFYEPEIVLAAAVLTAAAVGALTVYAYTTKTDFTYCGGAMWAFFFIVLTCSIMSFFMRGRVAQVWISGLVIFIVSFYIIFDTQLIMGNQSHALDIDDYVFAAMILYIDIVRLFLEILKILGRK